MLGVQYDSKKSTAPIFGFGSSDRANLAKVFLTPEHAKSDYGRARRGVPFPVPAQLSAVTAAAAVEAAWQLCFRACHGVPSC